MRGSDEEQTVTDEMILDRRSGDSRPVPDPTTLTIAALDREIKQLKELGKQQFAAVGRELELAERVRVEQKKDSLDSLAAALSAAKEAVGANTLSFEKRIDKSENATNDQLRQLGEKFETAIEGLLRSFSDLKEREASTEQSLATHTAAGVAETKTADKFQPWVFAVIMAVVAAIPTIILLSH